MTVLEIVTTKIDNPNNKVLAQIGKLMCNHYYSINNNKLPLKKQIEGDNEFNVLDYPVTYKKYALAIIALYKKKKFKKVNSIIKNGKLRPAQRKRTYNNTGNIKFEHLKK